MTQGLRHTVQDAASRSRRPSLGAGRTGLERAAWLGESSGISLTCSASSAYSARCGQLSMASPHPRWPCSLRECMMVAAGDKNAAFGRKPPRLRIATCVNTPPTLGRLARYRPAASGGARCSASGAGLVYVEGLVAYRLVRLSYGLLIDFSVRFSYLLRKPSRILTTQTVP